MIVQEFEWITWFRWYLIIYLNSNDIYDVKGHDIYTSMYVGFLYVLFASCYSWNELVEL